MNPSRRRERMGGYTIDQYREEGRGSKVQNPINPVLAEAKCSQKGSHIIPT
jgi:hypothetical protein